MTLIQKPKVKTPGATGATPVTLEPAASTVTVPDEKALKAGNILKALYGQGKTALAQQTIGRITGNNTDGQTLFGLQPGMDLQAIVVTLANSVGYAKLKQGYKQVSNRNLDADFGAQLASVTASRSGFQLGAADQALLTGMMLEQGAKKSWVVGNQLLDSVGKADNMGANLFMGTTHNLAQRPVNLPPAIHQALGQVHGKAALAALRSGPVGVLAAGLSSFEGAQVKDIQDPQVIEALVTEIRAAKQAGQLDAFLNRFQQQQGKSIYAYLGENVRDPELRQKALKALPQPISYAQLTYDAFLENLAVGLSYEKGSGAQLQGKEKGYEDNKRGGDPAALLKYFGYEASDVYAGKWGLELRVFTPKQGSKYKDVIVAFRGTEGVKIDLTQDGVAGTQDTLIGDFSPAGVGYQQMEQNRALLDHVMSKYSKKGPLLMTGHSLGGALAQIATVWYRDKTRRVVTFQGANIDEADVKKLNAYNSQARITNRIQATHYRVDGDVVPTAGEAAIPGTIHYFDADWKLKGETDFNTGLKRVANRAALGHVMPVLSMFIQDMDVPKDQTGLKLLQDKGIKDEQEVHGKADARVVYGGKYDTRQNPAADPRMQLEAGRDNVTGLVKAFQQKGITPPKVNYREIYEQELPYNTLLAHLEKLAVNAKDYPDFQKKALNLMGLSDKKYGNISLSVVDKDQQLADSLGLNAPGNVEVKGDFISGLIAPQYLGQKEIPALIRIWENFR